MNKTYINLLRSRILLIFNLYTREKNIQTDTQDSDIVLDHGILNYQKWDQKDKNMLKTSNKC